MEINISKNHIVIHGWMIEELKLKGNMLNCYALIYGFSQNEDNWFYGSNNYVAKWLNTDRSNANKLLNKMASLGIIIKESNIVEGVKVCRYRCNNLYSPIKTTDDLITDEDAEMYINDAAIMKIEALSGKKSHEVVDSDNPEELPKDFFEPCNTPPPDSKKRKTIGEVLAKCDKKEYTEQKEEIKHLPKEDKKSSKVDIDDREKNFRISVGNIHKDLPDSKKLSGKNFSEFLSYWTEKNIKCTQMRFEGEKYFDVKRRIATWKKNISQFNDEPVKEYTPPYLRPIEEN